MVREKPIALQIFGRFRRMLDVRKSPVLVGQVAQNIRFLFVLTRGPRVDPGVGHRCKHLLVNSIKLLVN